MSFGLLVEAGGKNIGYFYDLTLLCLVNQQWWTVVKYICFGTLLKYIF